MVLSTGAYLNLVSVVSVAGSAVLPAGARPLGSLGAAEKGVTSASAQDFSPAKPCCLPLSTSSGGVSRNTVARVRDIGRAVPAFAARSKARTPLPRMRRRRSQSHRGRCGAPAREERHPRRPPRDLESDQNDTNPPGCNSACPCHWERTATDCPVQQGRHIPRYRAHTGRVCQADPSSCHPGAYMLMPNASRGCRITISILIQSRSTRPTQTLSSPCSTFTWTPPPPAWRPSLRSRFSKLAQATGRSPCTFHERYMPQTRRFRRRPRTLPPRKNLRMQSILASPCRIWATLHSSRGSRIAVPLYIRWIYLASILSMPRRSCKAFDMAYILAMSTFTWAMCRTGSQNNELHERLRSLSWRTCFWTYRMRTAI